MNKLSKTERTDKAQKEFDKTITPNVLEECMALHKQLTRSNPEDYWRKIR